MTRDDISRMAEAAGFPARRAFSDLSDLYPRLERFAALVAAAEREACAKVCEPQETHDDPLTAWKIAAAIRERGEI